MSGARGDASSFSTYDESLAKRVVSVVTSDDLFVLEKSETEEQKATFQPRLRQLLTDISLSKNGALTKLLEVKRTSLLSKLWAKLFSEERDESTFTYSLEYPSGQNHLARFIIKRNGNDKVSFELLGKAITPELVANSEFNFNDKTFFEYFFLFVVFLIPAFIVYTFIFCLKTSIERKWVWLFCILFGFVQFDIYWPTGRIGLHPIACLFLGSGFQHAPDFGPWIFSTSLPIGALVFYWKQYKVKARPSASSTSVVSSS
jgi:hypothetical protein